jgi:hypothetical protein
MKNVYLIFLLLITNLGFGQSVSAPDPKTFLQSTIGQDASGFVINGFSTTNILLASISLVNPPLGTTFNLTTTTGLTAASGFTLTGNKTRLVVTGTQTNINTALSSLKVNTGSAKGNVQISVATTINPTGYFYNGVNGHFYRPISTGATYVNARAAALNTTFKGQQGYLVTITSSDEDAFIFNNVPQSQIWFALTDEVTEGRWVIDAGPEKGTVIKTSNGQTAGNIVGQYNNWAGGEPNNAGNEDYAVTKWNGSQWNDLPNNFNNPYVIEYGTWTNPDDQTFTEFYSNSVSHSNGETLRAQFSFDCGTSFDETRFTVKLLSQNNGLYSPTTNVSRILNGLGRVDLTNDLDTIRVNNQYKLHGVELSTNLLNFYNNIVTVSDVYTAFKELSNGGIFGNESGLEFTSGVQFINADVNDDNIFDERDTYKLLQHLIGTDVIGGGSNNLSDYIKMYLKTDYDFINKTNWNSQINKTGNVYTPLILNNLPSLNTFNFSLT